MGAMLEAAAGSLDWQLEKVDIRNTLSSVDILNRIYWHCFDHGRPRLARVAKELVRKNREFRPDMVIFSGISPFPLPVLRQLKADSGAALGVYLTDDPWNPCHRTGRFFDNIGGYDCIFTTKSVLTDDLIEAGAKKVEYLPFAYDPARHYSVTPSAGDMERYGCDVAYVGGGDRDRIGDFKFLLDDPGIRLRLYGGYWDKFPETRDLACGMLDAAAYRLAVACAKVNIVNGRRANRDQHAMRSFEIPAMGGVCVVEDSGEHRRIFGEDGECVLYYSTPEELAAQVRRLLADDRLREELRGRQRERFVVCDFSYAARLKDIAGYLGAGDAQPAKEEKHCRE